MITVNNLRDMLAKLGFSNKDNKDIYSHKYGLDTSVTVDFKEKKINYFPVDISFKEGCFPSENKQANGFVIHRNTTLNFLCDENFVCLVCVHYLLLKGYEAKHIVFEPSFKVGHINKPSYGDILVFDKNYNPLVLIENKTYGSEFSKEWNLMQKNGGQLFSYLGPLVNMMGLCSALVLFTADFDNNDIIYKNHIITLKDNAKRIKELNTNKTFAQAQGKFFDVWQETYGKSFETKGLFESGIDTYTIGKSKYTIDDLKALSHAEIKPIFHEFASILRNHAITDFEHSFYILIDLFLCKITDEKNNPQDLQFYYKGIAYDTPKDYCNRLLKLYQTGKKQLFDIDVVNKEEKDILQIFEDTNRTVKNGLYDEIKNFFEEIKFYNIKKFNFISVENKEDFELNFQILVKVAALIQDINLSDSETNHFFGDLFEGLLSKNVHQTEGQFFTPLPIVNFILRSLPEFENSDNLKILDYACGAGHFLTEFVKLYPNAQIYGIDKSQTLSQVAKIATIINGGKNPKIIFKDALSCLDTGKTRYQGFDKESFDCIIANPPYSVDGFLDTMSEIDRKSFELIKYVDPKTYDTNGAIECFFVERAEFFLKQYGLLAIILPLSFLTNQNIFIKAREILFRHFNILGIVSLNKCTFGSTGTNTIILFAQKIKKNAHGLVETFIKKEDITQYVNYQSIDSYIQMQSYKKEDFYAFMQERILSDDLEFSDIFQDYKEAFSCKNISKTLQKEWFNNSASTKFDDFLNSEEYKTNLEKEKRRQFILFAYNIEKEKLTTFIQIYNNSVVLLQTPPDKINNKSNKKEIVKFLGYDWSNKRGNEGIKYITEDSYSEKEEDNDENIDFMETVNSIKYIKTPLYNPQNPYDDSKFSFMYRKHILNSCNKFPLKKIPCTETQNEEFTKSEYSDLFSREDLSNLIDFNSAKFDRKIRTSPTKKIEIKSKYQVVKLKKIAISWLRGQPLQKDDIQSDGKHLCIHYGELFTKYNAIISDIVSKTNIEPKCLSIDRDILFPASDVTSDGLARCSSITKSGVILGSDIIVFRPKEEYEGIKINSAYLSFIINSQREQILSIITGSNVKHLSANSLKNIAIPLPPKEIQEATVQDFEQLLKIYTQTRMSVEDYRKKSLEILKNQSIIID